MNEHEMAIWKGVLERATHVRPRMWCGVWQLLAYNRNLRDPFIDGVMDSPDAYQAAREAGVSIEEPFYNSWKTD